MDVLIRRKEVERRVGFKRAYIYKMIARGDFPRPVKIGKRAVAWVEATVDDWIRGRIAGTS